MSDYSSFLSETNFDVRINCSYSKMSDNQTLQEVKKKKSQIGRKQHHQHQGRFYFNCPEAANNNITRYISVNARRSVRGVNISRCKKNIHVPPLSIG